MRVLRWLPLLCLALFLAGCGGKPKDLIIGKWEPVDSNDKLAGTREFTKEEMKISIGNSVEVKMPYKMVSDDTIEFTMDPQFAMGLPRGAKVDTKITIKAKVKVTKD